MNRLDNTFLQCYDRKQLPYLAAFSNCHGHNRQILEHSVERLESRNDHNFWRRRTSSIKNEPLVNSGRSALAPLPLLLTNMSSLSRVFEKKRSPVGWRSRLENHGFGLLNYTGLYVIDASISLNLIELDHRIVINTDTMYL